MRITKEFARHCGGTAAEQAKNAADKAIQMLGQFIQKPDNLNTFLDYIYPKELHDIHDEFYKHRNKIIAKLDSLTASSSKTPSLLAQHLASKYTKEDDTPLSTTHVRKPNFKIIFRAEDESVFKIAMDRLIDLNDEKTSHVIATKMINFKTLSGSGYYSDSKLTLTIDTNKLFDKETCDEYNQLVQTGHKLQTLHKKIKDREGQLESFTTLAQIQADAYIWPLVKDNAWVTRWIAGKEHDAAVRKAEAEKARKEARLAAAEARKHQLAEIQRRKELGLPEPEPEKPVKIDTSLVKAFNRLN